MPPPKTIIPVQGTAKAKPPGPHSTSPHGGIDLSDPRVRELSLDLLGLALDLAGIVDPSPVSDGASALLSITRGMWLDAIISGVSMVPYVGDLAKAGKLPRCLKSVEKAVLLAQQSDKVAQALLPAFRKLKQGLDLLPKGANPYLDRIRQLVETFLRGRGASTVAKILPDISKRFRFSTRIIDGKEIKTAEGWLGVPGHVKTHRSRSAQSGVSAGSGDDAGHLIGNQFGAPGTAENLSLQNWVMNRGSGTWYDLEKTWAEYLQKGYKVRVKVTDVAEVGKRPYHRKAEWTIVQPDGRSETRHTLDFLNATTAKGRKATGEINPYPPGHQADVIPINRGKKS